MHATSKMHLPGAQLSTLMQRSKPGEGHRTGRQAVRMPVRQDAMPVASAPSPLRAIYSIISFSYSYFAAAATDGAAAAAAAASVRCTVLAFYL